MFFENQIITMMVFEKLSLVSFEATTVIQT